MKKIRKMELWSLSLLALAFLVFTIAIPLVQESIDTTNANYSDYKFNLQQSDLDHGKFINTYDFAHFLEILLQEKIVTNQQVKAVLRIRDRLGFRCKELLADAIMSASFDPSDESDDIVARHAKLRKTNIDDLVKQFDKYLSTSPTAIGQKFIKKLRAKNRWKLLLYCFGSVFFLLGTYLQFASRKGEA